MQGLQEIWGINQKEISWATSGYLGAINSGQTTCGLLIGSSIAIGLKTGQGKECLPLESMDERNIAVNAVNRLYHDFLKEFGSTECQMLTTCDFSKHEELTRYVEKEIYRECCFKFFNFVMNRFVEMDKKDQA